MFKTTSTLQRLQKRSSDALGVFQATIANPETVNDEITKGIESNNKTINTLLDENKQYGEARKTNQNFIDKINDFLGI